MSADGNGNAKAGRMSEQAAIVGLAEVYSITPAAFIATFRAVAMPNPHTDEEFMACCLVAKAHGLNPLTKEIYFMRDKHGKIQALTGVDGWIKKCNEHPQFDGIEFSDHIANGNVTSITARIFRKDRGRPIDVTEYLSECRQKRDKPGPWDSHPNRMLRHRALIQCSRIAFGFAGLMDRDEFDEWQAMKDVTPAVLAVAAPPDIPDDPVAEPEIADPPIADEAGYLERLQGLRDQCESIQELQELAVNEAPMIKRLTDAGQTAAAEILREE